MTYKGFDVTDRSDIVAGQLEEIVRDHAIHYWSLWCDGVGIDAVVAQLVDAYYEAAGGDRVESIKGSKLTVADVARNVIETAAKDW